MERNCRGIWFKPSRFSCQEKLDRIGREIQNMATTLEALKPNYLVIGAAKAATTSLCAGLGKHPEVFMSTPKEINYFCFDEVYARGWDWYQSAFKGSNEAKAVGEGTVQYSQHSVWPKTVARIASTLPEARLIYITRHPLDRMESFWFQMLEMNYPIPFNFFDAIRADPKRLIESSNYLREIDAYRKHFSDDQILVLFYEDFRENPYSVLRNCFEFLQVDPDYEPLDADHKTNMSDDKQVEAPWLKKLRIHRHYGVMSKLIPSAIKQNIRKRTRIPIPNRPVWSDRNRHFIIEHLGSDTRTFLRRYGKSGDFWDLEDWARER